MNLQTLRLARQRILQVLFQLEYQASVTESDIVQIVEQLTFPPLEEDLPDDWIIGDYPDEAGVLIKPSARAFILSYVQAIYEQRTVLDQIYEPYLKNWTLERLPLVDRIILRIGTYEITKVQDLPYTVAIGEAVVLCRAFSDDRSRKYINALLGNLAHDYHPDAPSEAERKASLNEAQQQEVDA